MNDTNEIVPTSIRVSSVTKRYGNTMALDDVSLRIEPGELVALLGTSGSGKTTLLRSIAGLGTLDSGTIEIGGVDVTSVPSRLRSIGMVFQSYALFPNLNVARNISFPLEVRGLEHRKRVGELLELVGMQGFQDRAIHELSGGQQQRVALARALAPKPRVLLLDEPLSALDAVIRTNLRDEIRRIQQELRITTVHVTHDQSEALAIADRIAVMSNGQIVECAPPRQLYREPASAFTASFVGGRNTIVRPFRNGQVHLGTFVKSIRELAPSGTSSLEAMITFCPEDVIVQVSEFRGSESEVQLGEARVVGTTFHGSTNRISLALRGSVDTTLVAECPVGSEFTVGSTVHVGIAESNIRVFVDSNVALCN
jgi:putative spermidine/putrescine transport system ATP-binding protein